MNITEQKVVNLVFNHIGRAWYESSPEETSVGIEWQMVLEFGLLLPQYWHVHTEEKGRVHTSYHSVPRFANKCTVQIKIGYAQEAKKIVEFILSQGS
jgi:hypothetical protein